MLIEFKVKNFRSLRDPQVLSMVASAGAELLETNTLDTSLSKFEKLVRSAVIYGANAAGKTNLLRAMQFVQRLILTSATAIQQGVSIGHSPFKLSSATRELPSEFEISFVQEGLRYEYGMALDANRVHSEWLTSYPHGRPQHLFERTYNKRAQTFDWKFSSYLKGNRSVWRDATRPNALFLSTAVQLNSTQLLPVFDWFQKKLVVIVDATQLNPALTMELLNQPGGKEKILPLMQAADLGISDLELKQEPVLPGVAVVLGASNYVQQDPKSGTTLFRVTSFHPSNDVGESVPMDMSEESSGTQALFRSAGAWLKVLKNGEVLLFDELDTSLHPLLTRFLVSLFHSDSTNRANAQLVFTTHDTSLLEAELFRRDQIWFVEKTREGCSNLYPLSDFSPRKESSLERGYLKGRFGALPVIGRLDS